MPCLLQDRLSTKNLVLLNCDSFPNADGKFAL